MIIWNKIKNFVDKTYTDRETGKKFITFVLSLGTIGILLCLIWFALLCKEGLPLWCIIFDIAIIAFCAWAIIKAIIPGAKQVYKHLGEMGYKEKN